MNSSGETSFSSSAAAAATSLNVEPGSYASLTARLRHRFGSAFGSLGSKVGRIAMARSAPVFGSTTMTTPDAVEGKTLQPLRPLGREVSLQPDKIPLALQLGFQLARVRLEHTAETDGRGPGVRHVFRRAEDRRHLHGDR